VLFCAMNSGVRDIEVRRFAKRPANRKNPGVHHTARQSRDREGALADSVAGMRSPTVNGNVPPLVGSAYAMPWPSVRTRPWALTVYLPCGPPTVLQ
jgi:hypothetical protein